MHKILIILVFTLLLSQGFVLGYEVEGTLRKGTREQPMPHHPVALKQITGQEEAVIAVDTTDRKGRFRFTGLDSLGQYRLSVYYQTVKYKDITWVKPLPADHPLQVTVWDTT